jgi:hypothetical protein
MAAYASAAVVWVSAAAEPIHLVKCRFSRYFGQRLLCLGDGLRNGPQLPY